MLMLTQFERHHSLDRLQISFAIRLWVVQFVNTGLLTLIVNAKLPGLPNNTANSFDDFTEQWYLTVGTAIIVTMIINIIAPQFAVFGKFITKRCAQARGAKGARSQRDLNMRFMGRDFLVAVRYAQIMMTVSGTSNGHPI